MSQTVKNNLAFNENFLVCLRKDKKITGKNIVITKYKTAEGDIFHFIVLLGLYPIILMFSTAKLS